MRDTGMVREVDKMGRLVVPKEIRRQLNIEAGKDSFEIYMEGNCVVLRKFEPVCVFCGGSGESVTFSGHNVCCDCIHRLNVAESCLHEQLDRIKEQTESEKDESTK